MNIDRLVYWITERHSILEKRRAGFPKPWTQDKILQTYRFCNVLREDDTVTQWIKKHWRDPFSSDPNLFFLMTVSRLVNWPDTLAALTPALIRSRATGERISTSLHIDWIAPAFVNVMHQRSAEGKAFSGAYIVSTNGHKMDKAEYLATHVLTPLWNMRDKVRPTESDTLDSFHKKLMSVNGLGSFMAAQVVADVKYARKSPLYNASDWGTWAASGPGSRRGLNRVMCRPYELAISETEWRKHFAVLLLEVRAALEDHTEPGLSNITGQNLQNSLCEHDKMQRVLLGQGRPRSTYPGAR